MQIDEHKLTNQCTLRGRCMHDFTFSTVYMYVLSTSVMRQKGHTSAE